VLNRIFFDLYGRTMFDKESLGHLHHSTKCMLSPLLVGKHDDRTGKIERKLVTFPNTNFRKTKQKISQKKGTNADHM
jgi:hypothetical protein